MGVLRQNAIRVQKELGFGYRGSLGEDFLT